MSYKVALIPLALLVYLAIEMVIKIPESSFYLVAWSACIISSLILYVIYGRNLLRIYEKNFKKKFLTLNIVLLPCLWLPFLYLVNFIGKYFEYSFPAGAETFAVMVYSLVALVIFLKIALSFYVKNKDSQALGFVYSGIPIAALPAINLLHLAVFGFY